MGHQKSEKDIYNSRMNRAIGDQFAAIVNEASFAGLAQNGKRSSSSSALLSMVTILQYVEELPDLQAAQATATRMDWKYALHLPVHFPGVKPEVLCEFRSDLYGSPQGRLEFQTLLDRLAEAGLLASRARRGTTTGEVLQAICCLSRLEGLMRAMALAIEALAACQTEWLKANGLPHWYQRYGSASDLYPIPVAKERQEAIARLVGADVAFLLETVRGTSQPDLPRLPEIQALRRIKEVQFDESPDGLRWRAPDCEACAGEQWY